MDAYKWVGHGCDCGLIKLGWPRGVVGKGGVYTISHRIHGAAIYGNIWGIDGKC